MITTWRSNWRPAIIFFGETKWVRSLPAMMFSPTLTARSLFPRRRLHPAANPFLIRLIRPGIGRTRRSFLCCSHRSRRRPWLKPVVAEPLAACGPPWSLLSLIPRRVASITCTMNSWLSVSFDSLLQLADRSTVVINCRILTWRSTSSSFCLNVKYVVNAIIMQTVALRGIIVPTLSLLLWISWSPIMVRTGSVIVANGHSLPISHIGSCRVSHNMGKFHFWSQR